MTFINPWAYYQIHESDKIPDLNPHNDEEVTGCLAGVCCFVIASIMVSGYINIYLFPFLLLANCAVIYPILTILLMKLSFKIVGKIQQTIKEKL